MSRSFSRVSLNLIPISGLALTFLASSTIALQAAEAADIVFTGAKIYTVDEQRSWASAIAVSDGRILYVGNDEGAQDWIDTDTNVIDLDDKMVLPGFHDTHTHIKMGGAQLQYADLSMATSSQEILDLLKEYADAHPEREWIVGVNFPLHVFPDTNPRKEILDEIIADRPVYVIESEAHSAWMNSKALELAGIDKDTPDPKGAKIERDAETGEPSGTIREPFQFGINELYEKGGLFAAIDDIRRGIGKASEVGITSVMDPLVSAEEQSFYKTAEAIGALNARVTLAIWVDPTKSSDQIQDIIELYHKDPDHRLSTTAAKFVLDGVLTSKTGYLVDPYEGDPGNPGVPIFNSEELNPMVADLEAKGFSAQLHAVGDGALRQGLDAIEFARDRNGPQDGRHQLIHLDVVNPADMPRLAELDAIANIQPYWGYRSEYVKASEKLLGDSRIDWIYPYKSILDSGATMSAGSDWPITTMDPLWGMQVAITRKAVTGTVEDQGFLPDEALDLETMIALYTIDGAYALRQEDVTGSIEPGKYADLIVLDKNLFDVPDEELHEVKVLMTLLGGKIVYLREGGFQE